ncbi:MAG: CotH kinase family protein [Candidatus Cryptobacteroides sp.]
MKGYKFTKTLSLALLLALVYACEKNSETVPEGIVQPEGYKDIYELYASGGTYKQLSTEGGTLQVLTGDGRSIKMSLKNVVVEEVTGSNPKVVSVGTDLNWMVGGISTGVPKNPDLSDSEAIPFYLYISSDRALHLRISNGKHLIIKRTELKIPVVKLTTSDGGEVVSKEEYKSGTITINDPGQLYWDKTEFAATMRIRGRGNSTWGMPKKPYKIKLDDKARIFDMSTDKEWCLLANYCDKSLLRNLTAMEISRRLEFSWTPKMQPVEVYFNGRYDGVYNFCEHKKVSPERVDINVDAGDILFEIEQQLDEPVCWTTEHGCPIMFSDPELPSDEQIEYAKSYFKAFEDALWAKDFDTVFEKYIDKDSFINNFIIQELTKNVDGNLRKSTFLTLPKGGKLETYHVWDFDISMGNCDYYYDGYPTWQGWWIKDQGANGRNHGWYYRLFMSPQFTADVKERWIEVYPLLQTIPEYISEMVYLLGDAPDRNFKRWDILSVYVWPNAKVTGSYKGEVDWLLENYTKRLKWMDDQIRSW